MGDEPASALPPVAQRSSRVLLLPPAHAPPASAENADSTPPTTSRTPDDLVVVCTGSDGDSAALGRLQPGARACAIRALVGDIAEIRRLRSGALVFVAKSVDQVTVLLRQSVFCGLPVVMRPPKPRFPANFGVITGVDVTEDSAVLSSAFLAAGATEYSRLQRRTADGTLIDTRSIRLAFPGDLPQYVMLNFERLRVRPYVHRPLQCFRCQRYGHVAAHCRGAARCGRCSGPHASSDCDNDASSCAVCGAAHPAWSRECPHRVRACEIETVRAAERLTYAAAVRRVPSVAVQPSSTPSRTATASTQTDIPLPAGAPFPPTISALRTTREIASQTDCTLTSTACSQTTNPPTSEDATMTDSVIVIRQPCGSRLFGKDSTDGEEFAYFPLSGLRTFTALVVAVLDERRTANQKTSARALTKLVLDRFFTDDASD